MADLTTSSGMSEETILSKSDVALQHANYMERSYVAPELPDEWGDTTNVMRRMYNTGLDGKANWNSLRYALEVDCQVLRDSAQTIEDADRSVAQSTISSINEE